MGLAQSRTKVLTIRSGEGGGGVEGVTNELVGSGRDKWALGRMKYSNH